MSFGLDDFRTLQRGDFNEFRAITCMFTGLGSSLYAYMIMLKVMDRKEESKAVEDLRTRIFDLRSKFQNNIYGKGEHVLLGSIVTELRVMDRYLRLYKPLEAEIFFSPINHIIGLEYTVKEYLKLD